MFRTITTCKPFLLSFLLLDWGVWGLSSCGQKKALSFHDQVVRILGGREASIGSWPWQALLTSLAPDHYGFMCGATIVSDRWLLTAAHCIEQKYKDTHVQLGVNRVNDMRHVYTIVQLIAHPQYDRANIQNDIALIQTDRPISFNDDIQPICVTRHDHEMSAADQYGYITGFGVFVDPITKQPAATKSDNLLQARVPFIDQTYCRKKWSRMTLGATRIDETKVCAGDYMRGTAPGDSGGPLQAIGHNGLWYQIGITSFGANGNEGLIDQATYPGVYTRVSAYIDWINETISYKLNQEMLKSVENHAPSKNASIFYVFLGLFFVLYCQRTL